MKIHWAFSVLPGLALALALAGGATATGAEVKAAVTGNARRAGDSGVRGAARCEYCAGLLGKRYCGYEGRKYCSERCVELANLPHCSRCDAPCRTLTVIATEYGDWGYCTACARLPGCFQCGRPWEKMRTLPDGRRQCPACAVDAVTTELEAQVVFDAVRRTLARRLGFDDRHRIVVKLLAVNDEKSTELGKSREFGLFIHRSRVRTEIDPATGKKLREYQEAEECRIHLLSHVRRSRLAEVIAHELGHDFMRHRWPFITDAKLQEGFAECVAAAYNIWQNQPRQNRRMENNPDPVYGDGYRELKKIIDSGGWSGLAAQLDQIHSRARTLK